MTRAEMLTVLPEGSTRRLLVCGVPIASVNPPVHPVMMRAACDKELRAATCSKNGSILGSLLPRVSLSLAKIERYVAWDVLVAWNAERAEEAATADRDNLSLREESDEAVQRSGIRFVLPVAGGVRHELMNHNDGDNRSSLTGYG